MSDYHITLTSNACLDYFSNNTGSNFTNNLPNKLQLPGDWYVGISEIIYPYNWNNLKNKNRITVYEDMRKLTEETIHPGHYETNEDLIKYLNSLLEKMLKESGVPYSKISFQIDPQGHTVVKFYTITRPNSDKIIPRIYTFTLTEEIWHILGFHLIKSDTIIMENIRSEDLPNVHNEQSLMFIYSNIIDDQMVGGKNIKLLRLLTTNGKYSRYTHKIFNPVHYIKVSKPTIQNISISIKDIFDQDFNFTSGIVAVKLHFKKYE